MRPDDVITYDQMCKAEGMKLQKGMNFRPKGRRSVFLMSVRAGAPYEDRQEERGTVLIYEGHDAARTDEFPNTKLIDQPATTPSGAFTENGKFANAAWRHRDHGESPEQVRVYAKRERGVWIFKGDFVLTDAWTERSRQRNVFKFRLEIVDPDVSGNPAERQPAVIKHGEISSAVKLEVWERDEARCAVCGAQQDLTFEVAPLLSGGGELFSAENLRLACPLHA